MTDDMPFMERWARNRRRQIAALGGKPEFNIDIQITVPVAQEEAPALPVELAPMFAPAQEVGPDRIIQATVSQLKIAPKTVAWMKLTRELASELAVPIRDLWVRIDVRPENKCVTYTTNLISVVLAYRDSATVAGKLRLFVRFVDFAKAIEQEGTTEFGVEGRKLTYTSMGMAKSIDAFDKVDGDSYTPSAPPLTGYKLVRGLGLALREAAFFTKKTADTMGRHKVLAWPRKDATGTVDFVGCAGPLIYRREVQAPDLACDLFLEPLRALSNEEIIPDTLGFAMSGTDFVWLLSDTGFVIGLENEPVATPYDKDLEQYLSGASGRIEFSEEEIAALRRAVSQIRLNPETVAEKEMVLRPMGQSRMLEFGTKQNIQSVPCSGDVGPNIDVNPDLMAQALSVRGAHALEFDRNDPARPVIVVGPGVRVALKPLTPTGTLRP